MEMKFIAFVYFLFRFQKSNGKESEEDGLKQNVRQTTKKSVSYDLVQSMREQMHFQLQLVLLSLRYINEAQDKELRGISIMKREVAGMIKTAGGYAKAEKYMVKHESRDPCASNPCYKLTPCSFTTTAPGYKCGLCPPGMEGDGRICKDIDECKYQPCSQLTICINNDPGYTCTECPVGFIGGAVYGKGKERALENKQECVDRDECADNGHNCPAHARCINTLGGFYCGSCEKGYAQTVIGQCVKMISCGGEPGTTMNPCSKHATCSFTISNLFGDVKDCTCNAGYAGNGFLCGIDSDFDGYPDEQVNCVEQQCRKDNCPDIPNSDQSDTDFDFVGDICDDDDDNDSILDSMDNCPYKYNAEQLDDDEDGTGNECDNCKLKKNSKQRDTDGDGIGDKCDTDIDGDGLENQFDNCIYIPNDGRDTDKDGIGDLCDNCPSMANPYQNDTDINGIGDDCDSGIDSDHDGVIDEMDNCPFVQNAEQPNNDGDAFGNACDDDDDNDGFADEDDNCPLIHNLIQFDIDGNAQGDVCEYDYDDDTIDSRVDTCPLNRHIWNTNFTTNDVIRFDAYDALSSNITTDQSDWQILNKGQHAHLNRADGPVALVGKGVYEGFDMNLAIYVNTDGDEGDIGIVFSYQSINKYYIVISNFKNSSLDFKLVNNQNGTFSDETLLSTHHVEWMNFTSYHIELSHRPIPGVLCTETKTDNNNEIKIRQKVDSILIDSGIIENDVLRGGRIGLYAKKQKNVIWSAIDIRCNGTVPDGISEKKLL